MKKVSIVVALLLISMVVYGQSWVGGSGVLYVNPTSGEVAIGKTNANDKLDVNGTVRMTGFRLTTGVHSGYVLTCGSGGVGTWKAAPKVWSNNGSKIYYNSGYVGIGTNSPSAKLDIANLGGSNNVPILVMSEDANDEFVFKGDFAGSGETGNALKLETYWGNNAMTWRGDGYVGIGTSSPAERLHVVGTVSMNGFKLPTDAVNNYVLTSDGSGVGTWQPGGGGSLWSESGNNIYYNTGNVGIGTASPGEELDVIGTIKTDSFKLPTDAADGYVLTSDGSGVGTWQSVPLQWLGSGNDIYYETGNVCVGTDTPESELTVDGTITTREMKVQLTGWPDFVFSDNYKLMPLNKLEKHIKKEKNLPGIPTNKEVIKEGVLVGEMQAKLLEKIEELTLYVIELNKEVGDLRKENEDLREKILAVTK